MTGSCRGVVSGSITGICLELAFWLRKTSVISMPLITDRLSIRCSTTAFLKLWSADHKRSSVSALVVLLD